MAKNNINQPKMTLQNIIALCEQGKFKEAKIHLNSLYKENSQDPEVLSLLGTVEVQLDQVKTGLEYLEASLKIEPRQANTLNNIGNVYFELKRYDKALAAFDKALEVKPEFFEVYYNQGRLYSALEEYSNAIASYEKLIKKTPLHLWAHINLGYAYFMVNAFEESLLAYKDALRINPSIPQLHNNIGLTQNKLNDHIAAINSFNKAIQLNPEHREAYLNLASTLIEMDEIDEAVKCYRALLKFDLDKKEVLEKLLSLNNKMENSIISFEDCNDLLSIDENSKIGLHSFAKYYEVIGEFDKAIEYALRLIKLYPDDSVGYFNLSRYRKFTIEDPLIKITEDKLIEHADKDQIQDMQFHFALGKMYDDCKEWDKAFYHFSEAKNLKKESSNDPYVAIKKIEDLKMRIQVFNKDLLKDLNQNQSDSKLPIFIVGMPRSGTTLIEQIISSHQKINSAGELKFWNTPLDFYEKSKEIDIKEIPRKYLNWIKEVGKYTDRIEHITDKMPNNFMNLGVILSFFPNAKVIHCKRDPLDNCWSIFTANLGEAHSYSVTQKDLGEYYRAYQNLMNYWDRIFPNKIFHSNYEDLIHNQVENTIKLLDFIGLEWDEACLNPHKNTNTIKTYSSWQARQPLYKTSLRRSTPYIKYLKDLIVALDYKTD